MHDHLPIILLSYSDIFPAFLKIFFIFTVVCENQFQAFTNFSFYTEVTLCIILSLFIILSMI